MRRFGSLVIPMLGWLLVACTAPEPAPRAVAERVDNPTLGIAIAALPAGFVVTANQGARLTLEAPAESGVGRASFHLAREESGGVNIVAAAEDSKEWFEAQLEGQYFGNLELMTPIGSAFTARGAYRTDDGTIEELKVFALHPSANRLLEIRFLYPPGEGKERMQQLAELLGELEATSEPPQEASSAGADS